MSSLLATAANAVATLGPQLVALVSLNARDFGQFSLVYLTFALGSSLMLSVVAEAAHAPAADTQGRRSNLAAAGWLATTVGLLGGALALATSDNLALALLSSVGVGCTAYRVGARYLEVRTGQLNLALLADTVAVAGLGLGVGVGIAVGAAELTVVGCGWALSGVVSLATGLRPPVSSPMAFVRWCKGHSTRIRHLLRDSIVLDVSSIGIPYAIAPLLGVAGFGVYRAISNVAAPVRLLLNPLRPTIASGTRSSALSRRRLTVVAASAVAFGMAATGALLALDNLHVELGVLSDLGRYAVAAGLFVASSLGGHYLYLVARSHATGATLLQGRLVQSGIAIALPLAGAMTRDTTTAIAAYVGSTAAGVLVWLFLLMRRNGDSK